MTEVKACYLTVQNDSPSGESANKSDFIKNLTCLVESQRLLRRLLVFLVLLLEDFLVLLLFVVFRLLVDFLLVVVAFLFTGGAFIIQI